ncbi:type II and III secretion system protein family protein [Aestuariivirga sp.]|uniref:type II and III secretion system protein family protein n=1 Tax=Aestuariivirga sp. TaxID=2650926 RepID=UPI00301A2840
MKNNTARKLRFMHLAAPAAAFALALLMLPVVPAVWPGAASAATLLKISTEDRVARLKVVQGRSETFRLAVPFGEMVVGDPETADVNALSDRTLYVLGRKLGTTNVTLFDEDKNLLAVIDVEVTHDLSGLREALKQAVPGSNLKVRSVNGRVLLEGEVPSAPAAEKVMTIAKDFAGDDVTNSFSITANQQVNLEVRMIEVARSAGKELGFNWNLTNNGNGYAQGVGVAQKAAPGALGIAAAAGALSGVLPFGTIIANILDNGTSPDLLISALEQRRMARRLAEPNLTALSGQSASFNAGGQVPVQTCQGSLADQTCSVTYKDFGVILNFTPTVLDDGLINLQLNPTVSEIDPSLSYNGNPGFVVRTATTSVELRDGQSFAIAGLLQSLNAKDASQVPWVGNVPVIGTLFRSSAFQKKESDLVIIVTPRLVHPVGTEQMLKDPLNDGLVSANEPEFFLLGKQEVSRKSLDKQYNGVYGHIIDIPQVNYGAPQK